MWFNRKKNNRSGRQARSNVLDVKMRSGPVREARNRLLALAAGVVFGTVFGLYLLWRAGEALLDQFVYHNPDFAIERIDVQTDGTIPLEQLRRWSGVRLGQNLIGLDLVGVQRNLELVSMLDTVSVERILPQTLRIRVHERTPLAQVDVPHLDGNNGVSMMVYELDAQGHVMQPLNGADNNVPLLGLDNTLPVIVWTNLAELVPGRRLDSPQLQAALRLITLFKRSPMSGLEDLRQMDVSAPGVIHVTTGQGGQVVFGLDDPEQALKRWRAIYDWGFQRGKTIARIDLALENDVPVNWVTLDAVPAIPDSPARELKRLKPTKPTNYRRKNV